MPWLTPLPALVLPDISKQSDVSLGALRPASTRMPLRFANVGAVTVLF